MKTALWDKTNYYVIDFETGQISTLSKKEVEGEA